MKYVKLTGAADGTELYINPAAVAVIHALQDNKPGTAVHLQGEEGAFVVSESVEQTVKLLIEE